MTNDQKIAVAVAFAGWLAKYLYDVRLESRKNRLKFLSDQVQFLYGPFFSLGKTSAQAWRLINAEMRPNGEGIFGRDVPPLSEHELFTWRNWMTTVFMPLNLQMEEAIVKNSHLIEGNQMPECFLKLLAHIESYKVTLTRWSQQDYAKHTADLPYPDDLDGYVSETYISLCRQQNELLDRKY